MALGRAVGSAISYMTSGFSSSSTAKEEAPAPSSSTAVPFVEFKGESNVSSIDLRKLVHTPHFYKLISSRLAEAKEKKEGDRKLRFFVFGCAGEGTPAQKKVAEIMAAAKEKPDFIIVLGDNFYDKGVDDPNDPVFLKRFEDIYRICGVPCFVILGNHDYNICRTGNTTGVMTESKPSAQVLHSYLKSTGEVDPEKLKLYAADKLHLSQLPLWNMASRFSVMQVEEDVNLILADTNTFLIEYALYLIMLDEKAGKVTEKVDLGLPLDLENIFRSENQAEFLQKMYREKPARINLMFKHHPAHTIGKRSVPDLDDAWQYLSPKVIAYLNSKGLRGSFYNMNQEAFQNLGLNCEMEFAAHDHINYVLMKDGLTEVVAGGGGGEPQDRVEYKTSENVPYCESGEKHGGVNGFGYAEVVIDLNAPKNAITLAINNTQGDRYQFNPGSTVAHREAKTEEIDVVMFRQQTLTMCDAFLKVGEVGWGRTGELGKALGVTFYKRLGLLITPNLNLKAVERIKNYLNEFKAKTLFDYVKCVKANAPKEFIEMLDLNVYKASRYGTFENFYETLFPKTSASLVKESKSPDVELIDTAKSSSTGSEAVEEKKSIATDVPGPRSKAMEIPVKKVPVKKEVYPVVRFSPNDSVTLFSASILRGTTSVDNVPGMNPSTNSPP